VRHVISQDRRHGPILLYDGGCALCSRTVRLILEHDRRGTLRFASLQGDFAATVTSGLAAVRGVETVVWVDNGTVETHSSAVLRVAAYLGGAWRIALVLWLVPRPLRDWWYRAVARHRHRLAGAPQCFLPPAGARHRFLDA
jgi:predicted DCC family thiol-disulfide oxidoreductase YuxK